MSTASKEQQHITYKIIVVGLATAKPLEQHCMEMKTTAQQRGNSRSTETTAARATRAA
jgi:hypothetical protein